MKLLITAFEPFGGRSVNASLRILHTLETSNTNVDITKQILPVDYKTATTALFSALEDNSPDMAICMGEAGGIDWIQLERLAVNWMDFRIPDNGGTTITDEKIFEDGENAYFSTLPLRKMEKAIELQHVPVEISMSAGTYLCNQIFYTLMHWCNQQSKQIPAGFIHLPAHIAEDPIDDGENNHCTYESSLCALNLVLDEITN